MDLNEMIRWLLSRGAVLLIGTLALLLVYRIGMSAIHRIVPAVIHAQAAHIPSGSGSGDEVGKRIDTIEDLLGKLLRLGVLVGLVALVLAVLDLWSLLAAISVVVVALLLATRDVVLDYVMGILILVEGPFFKGDYVSVDGHPGIEGTVEEIGLRRTMLRDPMGRSHAVSNGVLRVSSNLTRLFSVAVVEFHVPRAGEIDRAMAIAAETVGEMRADPAWADRFLADAPADVWVTGIGIDGAMIRLQQHVPTGAQVAVGSELRRRLAAALAAASIGTEK